MNKFRKRLHQDMKGQEMEEVNVGFVGVGNFVSGNHLPNMYQNSKFKFSALCDLNDEFLTANQEKYNAEYITKDYTELMRDKEIQLIVCGTKHDVRLPIIKAAAEAAKDIFVEKPMSTDYENTRQIVEIVQESGVRLMVGFNRRFSKPMNDLKRIIKKLKKPLMIYYRIMDDSTLWPKTLREDMLKGGGFHLLTEICHIYDLISYLLDAEPISIYAIGEPEINNISTLKYDDGSMASIISGGMSHVTYPKESIEVFGIQESGKHAALACEMFLHLKVNGIEGERDIFYPYKYDPYADMIGESGEEGYRRRFQLWVKNIPQELLDRGYYYGHFPGINKGHHEEMDALGEAILTGKPSPCNEIDGARATVCALKALESMKSGKTVEIKKDDYFMK